MAGTAWRCSQCGTVNEAGARACRECGRWPSLFDLQDNVVEEVEAEPEAAQEPVFEVEQFEPETFEPETFDPGTSEPEPLEPEPSWRDRETSARLEREQEVSPRRRLVSSFLVPLALVVYLVISFLFGER